MRIAASWFWISLFGPTACKYVATMTQATGSGLRLVSCYLVVQVGSFRGGSFACLLSQRVARERVCDRLIFHRWSSAVRSGCRASVAAGRVIIETTRAVRDGRNDG